MNAPLLATKLYAPSPSAKLVRRPHLMARFAEGLARPLTIVSAPAGFGKTTLLGEWRCTDAGRAFPLAWLSLDADDNEPQRFFTYLIAALGTLDPQVGVEALALLRSSQSVPYKAILTSLINDLDTLPNASVLILDDYHVITVEAIHEAVGYLLEYLPPAMHLVILSRTRPPLPLARLRARDRLTEIDANDLRFTPEQVATFLNQVMGLNLPAEHVAALDQRTEGWIASLQLAALSIQGQDPQSISDFIATFSGSHHYIFDYLADEVLNRQTESARAFLLQTSVLERMCGPLCDAITQRMDGLAMLEQLEQANLFVIPLDHGRRWYRYHHLFADVLRIRLQQTLPSQVSILHHRAGEWYRSAGLMDEAVAHAFAANDLEQAAGLIDEFADQMNLQANQVKLSRWIEKLPHDLLRTRPWLCVYEAWLRHWTGKRELIEESLQNAEIALKDIPEADRKHIAGHIAAIRAHHALTHEDLDAVLEMGQKALELLPDEDHMRCEAAVAVGGAHWGKGNSEASEEAFNLAKTMGIRNGHAALAVSAACYVGMMLVKRGMIDQAFETFRDALDLAAGPGGKPMPIAGFANIKCGDVLRERNELEAACSHILTGVEQCIQLGQADVLTDSYVTLARLQVALGDLPSARQAIQKADEVTRRIKVDPFVVCWLDDYRVRLWLLENDLPSAVRWTEKTGLTIDGPLSYHYDLHHINLARVLVAQCMLAPASADVSQVLRLLDRLLGAARSAGWIQEIIKVLILRALALNTVGETEAGREALVQALLLAEPRSYVRLFVDEGAPMARLLGDINRRATAVPKAYVGKLLAAFGSPETGGGNEKRSADLLSERELEILELIAAGRSYQAIARELTVAVSTVQSHIKNIYQKLDAHSGLEAVARARERGLMDWD